MVNYLLPNVQAATRLQPSAHTITLDSGKSQWIICGAGEMWVPVGHELARNMIIIKEDL